MKKLLALVLVLVLSLSALTSCTFKEKVSGGFNKVKTTVGGWFGMEFEDEDDKKQDDNQQTPGEDTPGTDEPGTDEPGTDEPGTDEPGTDEPGTDEPEVKNYAAMAINFLNIMYGEVDPKTTTNYDLMSSVAVDGGAVTLTVVWTANVDSVTITESATEGYVTVNVPAGADLDLNYTITATVTDGNGNTASKTFERVVPSANTFMTAEEYYAATGDSDDGDAVVVKGIVTGIVNKDNGQSYNQLYVNDMTAGAGGYYVYDISSAPMSDLKVGMTVKVTGVKEVTKYNEHRIKQAVVTILDESITAVTPVDYTEIYKNAEALTDTNLVGKPGILVTLKGVEITGQTLESGYYHFLLGDKESYVRISSSTCCLYGDDLETFKENHTNNKGNTADVVGVLATYNKAFYIIPVSVDAFSNFKDAQRTPEEKINYELGALDIPTSVKADKVIELLTTGKVYNDVTVTWKSDNTCAVVSDDYTTVTITLQDEAQTVVLTATATIGDTKVEKTFTINVDAKPDYVVEKVTAPVAGTAYKLYLFHGTEGRNMFLTGRMDGYNLGITGDLAQSVDFYLEAAEGGYYLTATVDGIKYYVNRFVDGKYVNVDLQQDKVTVYKYDETTKTLVSEHTTSEGTFDFYFGTYSTANKTGVTSSKTSYITGSNAANVGKTQFVVYLVTVTQLGEMSDADKVAAEKNALNVDTAVTGDKTVDLPTATVPGVTVEWSVTDNAKIEDGKLVITQGSEAITVVLTATIQCGEATDTKTFTFEVPKKVNLVVQPVYTYEENQEYLLAGTNSNGEFYFSGETTDGGRLNGTTEKLNAVKVYVKFVDKTAGTFLLYFKEGDTTKKYITAVSSSSKAKSFKIVGESELGDEVWYLADDGKTILTSAYASADRFISTDTQGTYASFSTYQTGQERYAAAYLAVLVDESEVPEVTDEEKVAAALNGVDLGVTEVTNDAAITLPTPAAYADEVTFAWSVEGACAAIVDGKLVITLPLKDTKITVTLTATCGDEATDTKTYEIDVVVPVFSIQKVTTPEVGKGYKLYLYQPNTLKHLFFAGDISGDYLTTTTSAALAFDVYLEAAEGGYYLYFENANGDKKYIEMYEKTANKVRIKLVDEPGVVYVMHDELNTIVAPIQTTTTSGTVYNNKYYFGTYSSHDTFSANSDYYVTGNEENTNKIGVSQFVAYLVEVSCKHAYSTECDTVCNECGETRETTVNHNWEGDCDTTCDCGETREVNASHYAEDKCATACDVCGEAVVPTHKYASDCDTTCDCGATREVEAEHTVTDECDADCNLCGEAVVPTHKYVSDCDTICDCGATRETTVDHTWAGECDTACDLCGATREVAADVAHTTELCTDETCKVCGAAVTPKAHVYDGCDDTDCANCTATREALEHKYDADCDATCNNAGCDYERETTVKCTDTNNDGICDNVGCGKEIGPDTPDVDVNAD